MNTYKKLFFEILQCGLWGKLVKTKPTKEDIREVVKLAHTQAVLAIVADVIISNDELADLLTDGEVKALRRFVLSNLSTSRSWNIAVQKIVLELRSHNIEPILLKGQGIAQYYPNPDLRQCGDIDLYVGEEEYVKSCEIISSLSTDEDHKKDKHLEKHLHTHIGKVPVEIHRFTDVYYQKRLNRIYQEISAKGLSAGYVTVDFAGYPVSTPPVDFNAFYIFNHLWHHFIGDGVGLRQICDWTILLHKSHKQINRENLYEFLTKMGLLRQWCIFGYIAVDILGLPENEFPFYNRKNLRLSKSVLDLVLLEGNFGQQNIIGFSKPEGYFSAKFYSFKFLMLRNLRILKLFPREALIRMGEIISTGFGVIVGDKFSGSK